MSAALLAIALPGTASAGTPTQGSQSAHSYAEAIRETVYVQAPVDGDRDGRNDRIVVDLIRPKETVGGLKVPVILEASPYFSPIVWPEGEKAGQRLRPEDRGGYKDDDDDGTPTRFAGYYDNFFVPRGYAVVQVDLPGTRYSEGCATLDGKESVAGVKAVLDWLDGRGTATDKSGRPVQAGWDNGKVGMIGKSRPGVLANVLATQDAPNLKTIVPISAYGSWYPYLRTNGLPRFADYPRWSALTDSYTSKLAPERCQAGYDAIPVQTDEENGTYTPWFAERDYVAAARTKLKASVFMVHGLNDYNVTPDLALQWWEAVKAAGVPRKLMLTQMAHVNPLNSHREHWLPQLHRWFDHWLLGLDTGIMNEPQVQVERMSGQWSTYSSWPAADATATTLWLDGQTLTGTQPEADTGRALFTDKFEQREKDIVASPESLRGDRLAFLGKPLTAPLRLSGAAEVTVTAKADASGTPLSAFLVDYGTDTYTNTAEDGGDSATVQSGIKEVDGEDCLGQGTATDRGCAPRYAFDTVTRPFEIVSKVMIDTENRSGFETDIPVQPDKYYTYRLKLQPDDYVFKPGHRIGLVIAGTNCTAIEVPGTDWCGQPPTPGNEPWPKAVFEVDLSKSFVSLPVAPR